MKNQAAPKHTGNEQGNSTSDRMYHNPKQDRKMTGITNGGGQRSDQTSNRDNTRKRENK
ncbi:hypothetical protein [Pedobacter yulinensis]|nr:hypothetical protein [Pedobacter yulinensis]